MKIIYELHHELAIKMTCAPLEILDQLWRMPSMVSDLTVLMKNPGVVTTEPTAKSYHDQRQSYTMVRQARCVIDLRFCCVF